MRTVVAVLARAPVPGAGKSRLRRGLSGRPGGDVEALVTALVEDTLAWSGPAVSLISGDGDLEPLRRLGGGRPVLRQPDGDLGRRIEAAVTAGLHLGGGGPVVLVGTDSPTLPALLLQAAAAAAAEDLGGVALVPALDGGWVALSTARPLDGALQGGGVPWGSAAALPGTVAALAAAGRTVRLLEPWFDIDEVDDLHRLLADPRSPGRAPRTWAAAHRLLASTPLTRVAV